MRKLAIERTSKTAPLAYLTDIGAADAGLFLPDSGLPLYILSWPIHDLTPGPTVLHRIQQVSEGSPPSTHILLVGGGAEARRMCEEEQPFHQLNKRAVLHHLSEDGTLWNASTRLRPLDSAVEELTDGLHKGEPLHALTLEETFAARDAFRKLAAAEQAVATAMRRRRIPGTIGLIAAIVLMYGLEMLWGGSTSPVVLYKMGAVDQHALLHGEWWRLISPAFLHNGPLHIGVNGYSLWVLGVLLERLFGTARFLVLYTVGVLGAAVASSFFSLGMSVGASGAIFALMGGLFAVAWRPHDLLPPTMIRRLRRSLWPPLAMNLAISMVPSVDWRAHLGGMISGVLLVGSGLLLRGLPQSSNREGTVPRSTSWAVAAALSVLLLTSGVAAALVHGRPWDKGVGPLERVSLGSTHVSLEIPQSLGQAETQHEASGDEFTFGDLSRTPIVVAVLVVTDDGPGQLSKTAQADFLTQQATAIKVPHAKQLADPQIRTTPNGALAHLVFSQDDGIQLDVWLVILRQSVVRLEIASVPQVTPGWSDLSATLAASLQDDGTAI